MTVFLPLEDRSPSPSIPQFVSAVPDTEAQIAKLMKTILKAKRIVVVCGAGISVQAGIPDFRSSEGLFHTLKKENPKDGLTSGKDLFDASVFKSEQTTTLFCQMIARLAELSQVAQPTPFHRLLRSLDDRGRLLRVYTQNIDALESKSGLTFGIPEFESKRTKTRSSKSKTSLPLDLPMSSEMATKFSDITPSPTPPPETPRCIPLHGTLETMYCQMCHQRTPLTDHLPSLFAGELPTCSECQSMEAARVVVGKRRRTIGKLRPSVILYNESHKDGEGVGEAASRDLIGSGKGKGRGSADLLLVVGTSLRVSGTKRMVREFAKSLRSPPSSKADSPSPAQKTAEEPPPMKSIYLNLDFPVPTREWEGVFDVWLQGDAQIFAQRLQVELDKAIRAKEQADLKKKQKEEEMLIARELLDTGMMTEMNFIPTPPPTKSSKKRKVYREPIVLLKKRKVYTPPDAQCPSGSSSNFDEDIDPPSDDELPFIDILDINGSYHTPMHSKHGHWSSIYPPTPDKSPSRSHTQYSPQNESSRRPSSAPSHYLSSPTLSLLDLDSMQESEDPDASRLAVSFVRTTRICA